MATLSRTNAQFPTTFNVKLSLYELEGNSSRDVPVEGTLSMAFTRNVKVSYLKPDGNNVTRVSNSFQFELTPIVARSLGLEEVAQKNLASCVDNLSTAEASASMKSERASEIQPASSFNFRSYYQQGTDSFSITITDLEGQPSVPISIKVTTRGMKDRKLPTAPVLEATLPLDKKDDYTLKIAGKIPRGKVTSLLLSEDNTTPQTHPNQLELILEGPGRGAPHYIARTKTEFINGRIQRDTSISIKTNDKSNSTQPVPEEDPGWCTIS